MARQWSATPSTAVRIRSIPLEKLVLCNKLFFIYLSIFKRFMRIKSLIFFLLFVCSNIHLFSQCEYVLTNYSHNNCFEANNGTIDISIPNANSSVIWSGPDSFTSSSTTLTNLFAGTYYLTITNNIQSCSLTDSIQIQESNKISGSFELSGRCNKGDSVNVVANIWGGTPPYEYLWSDGQTILNANNLPATQSTPNVLTITDANFCTDTLHVWVRNVNEMISFMSSVGVICKDDNSGQVRVFVQEGTPPYEFNWMEEGEFDQLNDVLVIDSFSSINGLLPNFYSVEIVDDMGCILLDSIEVKSNARECLTMYNAFSPNDDAIHEFWEIKNIHIYPNALVSVYDRNGKEIFRRRNYTNTEAAAFGGRDKNDQPLPSATYYYLIDLENGDDVIKGIVTIVR